MNLSPMVKGVSGWALILREAYPVAMPQRAGLVARMEKDKWLWPDNMNE
jgi:hypothetical protein